MKAKTYLKNIKKILFFFLFALAIATSTKDMYNATASIVDLNITTAIDAKIIQVVATSQTHLALDEMGRVYYWGNIVSDYSNYTETSNTATTSGIAKPMLVTFPAGAGKIVSISVATYNCYALDEDGFVYSWGLNLQGQFGNQEGGLVGNVSTGTGKAITSTAAAKIDSLSNIVRIASSAMNGFALDSSGNVYAWGAIGVISTFQQASEGVSVCLTVRSLYCQKTPTIILSDSNITNFHVVFDSSTGSNPFALAHNDDFSIIYGWGVLTKAEDSTLATGTVSVYAPRRLPTLEAENIKEFNARSFINNNNEIKSRITADHGVTGLYRYEKIATLDNGELDWYVSNTYSTPDLKNLKLIVQRNDQTWYGRGFSTTTGNGLFFGYRYTDNYNDFIKLNLNILNDEITSKSYNKFGDKYDVMSMVTLTVDSCSMVITKNGQLFSTGRLVIGSSSYSPYIGGFVKQIAQMETPFEAIAYDTMNADKVISGHPITTSTTAMMLRIKSGLSTAKITTVETYTSVEEIVTRYSNATGVASYDLVLSGEDLPQGTSWVRVTNTLGTTEEFEIYVIRYNEVIGQLVTADGDGLIADTGLTIDVPIKLTWNNSSFKSTYKIGTANAVPYTNGTIVYPTATEVAYTFYLTDFADNSQTFTITLVNNFSGPGQSNPPITVSTLNAEDLRKIDDYDYNAVNVVTLQWDTAKIAGIVYDNIFYDVPGVTLDKNGIHSIKVIYYMLSQQPLSYNMVVTISSAFLAEIDPVIKTLDETTQTLSQLTPINMQVTWDPAAGIHPIKWFSSTDGVNFTEISDATSANYIYNPSSEGNYYFYAEVAGHRSNTITIKILDLSVSNVKLSHQGNLTQSESDLTPVNFTVDWTSNETNPLIVWTLSTDGINYSTITGVIGANYTFNPSNYQSNTYYFQAIVGGVKSDIKTLTIEPIVKANPIITTSDPKKQSTSNLIPVEFKVTWNVDVQNQEVKWYRSVDGIDYVLLNSTETAYVFNTSGLEAGTYYFYAEVATEKSNIIMVTISDDPNVGPLNSTITMTGNSIQYLDDLKTVKFTATWNGNSNPAIEWYISSDGMEYTKVTDETLVDYNLSLTDKSEGTYYVYASLNGEKSNILSVTVLKSKELDPDKSKTIIWIIVGVFGALFVTMSILLIRQVRRKRKI